MAKAKFEVVQPTSIAEVCSALSEHGAGAQMIAGGTDLLRDIRIGAKSPDILISLDRLDELSGVRQEADALWVGPLTPMAELAKNPAVADKAPSLADAASSMGSPQVRNRATFGGNLCNARPCADTAPAAIVCDAMLELQGPSSTRQVPAGDFMVGPGQTVLKADEILIGIRFPNLSDFSGSSFMPVTNRKAVEITITSATARLSLSAKDGPIEQARICLGSVAPTPVRAPSAEGTLIGQMPSQETLRKAAIEAVGDCTPIDDLRGTAAYRRWMVETLVYRALETSLARARGGAS